MESHQEWQSFQCACLTARVRAAPRLLLLASTGSLQTTLQAHPPLQTCRSVVGALRHLTLQFNLLWLMAWCLWWLRATARQTHANHRPQVNRWQSRLVRQHQQIHVRRSLTTDHVWMCLLLGPASPRRGTRRRLHQTLFPEHQWPRRMLQVWPHSVWKLHQMLRLHKFLPGLQLQPLQGLSEMQAQDLRTS